MTAVLVVLGVWAYKETPVETFPDVTNTQIIIIAQWPGRSAEEVEKFITIPLETVLNSVQKKPSPGRAGVVIYTRLKAPEGDLLFMAIKEH
jgi:Cu/Ag efflux pump CusA